MGEIVFVILKVQMRFFFVTKLRNTPHYDTFTVDEQGVVVNDKEKIAFGENILPFTTGSLDVF